MIVPKTLSAKVDRMWLTNQDLDTVVAQHGHASSYGLKAVEGEHGEPVAPSLALAPHAPAADLMERVRADLLRVGRRVLADDRLLLSLTRQMGELGFDSLRFTDLAMALNDTFQFTIEPTLFYEHSTLEAP